QRMLAKDPTQRPQSAQEALSSLARIKTEWMQQSTDGDTFDAIDFQFEADIGERWPTNVEDGDGVLALPEPGKPSVSTRSEWGGTVDRKGPFVGQVALAALGFAAVTAV